MNKKYQALFLVSFGGPEGMEDVLPFLENVLRGKNIPEVRKKEVALNYARFGGVSPINAQNRELKQNLEKWMAQKKIPLKVYWGNRNWKPYIGEAIVEMKKDGVKNALAFVTSAYSSYSGCRQYREDIQKAREKIGEGVPEVEKIRAFFNHPLFIGAHVENIQACLKTISKSDLSQTQIVFSAHSIPMAMSQTSDYLVQLQEACKLVAQELKWQNYSLVFQSRSGPPKEPWLEPDISEHLKKLQQKGIKNIVNVPIGFVSDHMEVIYDLDIVAKENANKLGLQFVRSKTPGGNPKFIEMIVELVEERLDETKLKRALGSCGPSQETCQIHCCAYVSK